MTEQNNEQVRRLVVELLAATATEMALAGVARRLKNGPSRPGRRYVRRIAGAVLSEMVAEGLADLYWQRRRFRAEVDRRIITARIENAQKARPAIPRQRSGDAPAKLAEELRVG